MGSHGCWSLRIYIYTQGEIRNLSSTNFQLAFDVGEGPVIQYCHKLSAHASGWMIHNGVCHVLCGDDMLERFSLPVNTPRNEDYYYAY